MNFAYFANFAFVTGKLQVQKVCEEGGHQVQGGRRQGQEAGAGGRRPVVVCGFAAFRAESLWLSGGSLYFHGEALPHRRRGKASCLLKIKPWGMPKAFPTERGKAARMSVVIDPAALTSRLPPAPAACACRLRLPPAPASCRLPPAPGPLLAAFLIGAGNQNAKALLVFAGSEERADHGVVIGRLSVVQSMQPEVKTTLVGIASQVAKVLH